MRLANLLILIFRQESKVLCGNNLPEDALRPRLSHLRFILHLQKLRDEPWVDFQAMDQLMVEHQELAGQQV